MRFRSNRGMRALMIGSITGLGNAHFEGRFAGASRGDCYTLAMEDANACPICTMTDLLVSGDQIECVTCGHEWENEISPADAAEVFVVKDSNGNVLSDGDSVTLIKDLKVKGSTVTIKAGTKIKRIRIVEGDHDVDCKFEGMGVMLKAIFLKKA